MIETLPELALGTRRQRIPADGRPHSIAIPGSLGTQTKPRHDGKTA
jgi:hypothetical protein